MEKVFDIKSMCELGPPSRWRSWRVRETLGQPALVNRASMCSTKCADDESRPSGFGRG